MKKDRSARRKKLHKKWIYKYRLVILNEDTFEEQVSFKLNRLNVFVIGSVSAIFLIAFTTVLIAFTPLREYIPGYSSVKLEREVSSLITVTDSLKQELEQNDKMYTSIQKVLKGELKPYTLSEDSVPETHRTHDLNINIEPNKADSILREEVAKEDRYNFSGKPDNIGSLVFFAPVNGTISDNYNLKKNHFGVDIAATANAPVKAVADGQVVFAEWTAETGNVIVLVHNNGFISVYKHNASLNISQGDSVKTGEVIAMVGNTGELTTGPHLHFELWSNMYPVDPTLYIDFK